MSSIWSANFRALCESVSARDVCSSTRPPAVQSHTLDAQMARDTRPAGNIVGPKIRRLRNARGWSQPELAARCQRIGWDVRRDIIARIESQIRLVTDSETLFLARALGASVIDLFPTQTRR